MAAVISLLESEVTVVCWADLGPKTGKNRVRKCENLKIFVGTYMVVFLSDATTCSANSPLKPPRFPNENEENPKNRKKPLTSSKPRTYKATNDQIVLRLFVEIPGLLKHSRLRILDKVDGMVETREVMDIRGASQYLGVSRETLYKYVYEEKIPAFKLGNRWKFKKTVLDRWMERQSAQFEHRPRRNPRAIAR